MRLIDADNLKAYLREYLNYDHAVPWVDAQPTAYDVNAVMEQLQKNADKNRGFYIANLNDNAQGQMIAYLHAIEIVKGGGVNGN